MIFSLRENWYRNKFAADECKFFLDGFIGLTSISCCLGHTVMLSTILSLRSLFVRNKLESARKFQHLAKKKHCRIHWEREWYFLEKGKLCNFRAENQHIGKPWGNLVTQERDRKGNEFNGPMNDTRVWISKCTPYWTFVLSDSRLFVVRLDYVCAHLLALYCPWAHYTGESR